MVASVSISSYQTSLDHEDVNPLVVSTQKAVGPSRWPRLLSRTDLAEYLAVSPRHIDALVSQGLIPPAKFRPSVRVVRWDRADVDAALDRVSMIRSMPGRSFDDILAPTLVSQDRRTKTGGR